MFPVEFTLQMKNLITNIWLLSSNKANDNENRKYIFFIYFILIIHKFTVELYQFYFIFYYLFI
jgi:hypothetical protein